MSTSPTAMPTLQESVERAVNTQEIQQTQITQTTETQPVVQPQTQETQTQQQTQQTQETQTQQTQQTQAQPTAPTAEEQKAALNIYNLLNDPKTAPSVVKMLAESLGLKIDTPQTQQTQPTQTKEPTIEEIIANNLGEEYRFLAPNLAKAITQVIDLRVTPIQRRVDESRAEVEFNTAITKLNETSKGDFQKHESAILQLMDRLKPGAGVSVHDYLNELYTLAKGKSPISTAPASQVQQVVDRMQKNAQENLPSPSAATENRVIKGPALPTLEESIAAALKGERFE